MSGQSEEALALDRIALLLGTSPVWDGSEGYLNSVSDIIGEVRPTPGLSAGASYLRQFFEARGFDPTSVSELRDYVDSITRDVCEVDGCFDKPGDGYSMCTDHARKVTPAPEPALGLPAADLPYWRDWIQAVGNGSTVLGFRPWLRTVRQ